MKNNSWIDVDLRGLQKILSRRGKEFLVYELVQNAWDERASTVEVTLPRPVRGRTILTVIDDAPEGFRNLAHAFTLFAESYKKGNGPCKLTAGKMNAAKSQVRFHSRCHKRINPHQQQRRPYCVQNCAGSSTLS
jgi:hypothetical protein